MRTEFEIQSIVLKKLKKSLVIVWEEIRKEKSQVHKKLSERFDFETWFFYNKKVSLSILGAAEVREKTFFVPISTFPCPGDFFPSQII